MPSPSESARLRPTPDAAALGEAVDAIYRTCFLSEGERPTLGIVLGSGLGGLLDGLDDRRQIPVEQVPHFPRPRAAGHPGRLAFGRLGGAAVLVLAGRVHLYEGHSAQTVTFGVRLLARLGCRAVALTNAAGGIRQDLQPGALMLIRDHLNLTGQNPLAGAETTGASPGFVDMTDAYDPRLRRLAQQSAGAEGLTEGVYAGMLGPSYETPAEVRMLEALGADAVGMSTVCEVIALRHEGVPVLGLSTITNTAAGRPGATLDHNDVQAVASQAASRGTDVLAGVAERMDADHE